MELRFYEMHFEELRGTSDSPETSAHNLLCMSRSGETFSAQSDSDSIFHLTWKDGALVRRRCFRPKDASCEMVLLYALSRDSDVNIVLGCVYYTRSTSSKYVLVLFSLDLESLTVEAKQELVLHSKPNLLHLFTDHDGACVVLLTFYSEPCTEVLVYQGEGGLSRDPNRNLCPSVPRTRSEITNLDSLYVITADTWIDHRAGYRYVACGTVDGNVYVDVCTREGRKVWSDCYDWEGPISSVRFLSVRQVLCLVAACAVEQVVLFTHLEESRDLSRRSVLPDSTLYDTPTCLQLMDIDYDKEPEILVGTYGSMLLVYKLYLTADGVMKPVRRYIRNYNSPIFNICYSDITQDGLFEIILLSYNGLHVLQRCLKTAAGYIGRILRDYTPTETCPFFSEHYG